MAQGAKPTSSRVITIDGITLHLAQPMSMGQEWIGNREILKQLLACWLVIDERDLPLSPRITGQPGIGKTTLAMAGARERKQDLYVFQCTADTRPEDLLITPVLAESGTISYHASPLITAVLTGSLLRLVFLRHDTSAQAQAAQYQQTDGNYDRTSHPSLLFTHHVAPSFSSLDGRQHLHTPGKFRGASAADSQHAKGARIRSKAAKVKVKWAGTAFDPFPTPMLPSGEIRFRLF